MNRDRTYAKAGARLEFAGELAYNGENEAAERVSGGDASTGEVRKAVARVVAGG